jgi:hypothetical protein
MDKRKGTEKGGNEQIEEKRTTKPEEGRNKTIEM